jgi:hypothetical protein
MKTYIYGRGGGAIATRRRRRWNDPIARREVLHCRAHRKHLSYTLISTDCRQRWPHWVYSFNSIYIRGIDWSCHHFDADILLFHFHTFHLYYSAPTHLTFIIKLNIPYIHTHIPCHGVRRPVPLVDDGLGRRRG